MGNCRDVPACSRCRLASTRPWRTPSHQHMSYPAHFGTADESTVEVPDAFSLGAAVQSGEIKEDTLVWCDQLDGWTAWCAHQLAAASCVHGHGPLTAAPSWQERLQANLCIARGRRQRAQRADVRWCRWGSSRARRAWGGTTADRRWARCGRNAGVG